MIHPPAPMVASALSSSSVLGLYALYWRANHTCAQARGAGISSRRIPSLSVALAYAFDDMA